MFDGFAGIKMAESKSRLAVEIATPAARITLSHPPLNVIDFAMMDELVAALARIEARTDVSVIHIRGAGKSFSAGVDVAAHEPSQVAAMLQKFHALIHALVASRKITVAEVHGQCLGGGAELAMVCDLVYTTDDTIWGFPEIQLGCFPPVAVTALASLISPRSAAELILTGKKISGAEAAAIGLATGSAKQEQLSGSVSDTLDRLAGLSAAALAVTKKATYAWDAIHFDKGLARAEKIYLEELMKTDDAQEGIRAFLEKRNPKWKNH